MWTLLLAAAGATEYGPPQTVIWPEDTAPRDAVIYVRDAYGPLAAPPLLLAGVPVPTTDRPMLDTQGRTWHVLVPDALLEAGATYTVTGAGGYGDTTFEVEDRLAAPVGPPVPYRRWRGDCETGVSLAYRVCGDGVVHLVAFGDTEPPTPSLDAPGDARIGSSGEATLSLDVSSGWDLTVWVGDLDEAGRFGGWWAGDPVEPPPSGMAIAEKPIGATGGTDTTATGLTTCPPFSGWERLSAKECGPTELVVVEVSECGCQTGPSPATPLVGLALAACLSRRTSRSRRTGSAAPR